MNQLEIPALIEEELPVIASELRQNVVLGSAQNAVKILANYTKRMLTLHDLPTVVRCMQIADKIHERGNLLVKNAIENIFVYSFSGMQLSCNKTEWKVIKAKMPQTLYTIYAHQVCRSGL